MKKILVPVSGSNNAPESAAYAMKIANAVNAEIHVLHVVRPNAESGNSADSLKMFELASDKSNIPFTSVTVHGKVVDQIIEYAESNDVSLILMGASNGFVVDKWISNEVLGQTAIPVLVMPYQIFD